MKGFPKVIKTKSDLVNTFKLVQKKKLKKEDWLAAVENWKIRTGLCARSLNCQRTERR